MTGKRISRRAVLGGFAGSIFGFLRIKPEDTSSEAAEKVLVGGGAGAFIGAVSGVGDTLHNKIKPTPSERELRDAERYRQGKWDEYLRNRSLERDKDRHNDDSRER